MKNSWRTLALLASLVMVVAASCAGTGDKGPEPYECSYTTVYYGCGGSGVVEGTCDEDSTNDDDSGDDVTQGFMGGGCNCYNPGFQDDDSATDDDDVYPPICEGIVYHLEVSSQEGVYCFTDEAGTCLSGFGDFPIVRGWTDTWGATLEVNQNLDCQAYQDGVPAGGVLEIVMFDDDEEECDFFTVIYQDYYFEPITPECSL